MIKFLYMKLHVIFRLATSLYRSCFVYVFVLLCLAGFLNSCEREVLKGDEKIVQVEPATWQEQIKYAQNRNRIGTETYNSDRPCLLNYTYKGTIESETERQKLLEELFADTTMVVWYKDFWHFEILSLNFYQYNYMLFFPKYVKNRSTSIDHLHTNDSHMPFNNVYLPLCAIKTFMWLCTINPI